MAEEQLTGSEETLQQVVGEIRDDLKKTNDGHAVTQAAVAKSTETVLAHLDRKIEPIERAVKALFGSRS